MTVVATNTSDASGTSTAAPKGLLSRAIGVVFSPGETYADIAARPRVLGVLLLVTLLTILAVGGFLMTDVGLTASLDQQFAMMESFGFRISDEQARLMEE